MQFDMIYFDMFCLYKIYSNKDKQTVPYNAAVIPVYGDHFLIPGEHFYSLF